MTETAIPPAAERDIEHLLRQGKSAQWVATNMGEPMPLVMKVLDRLRKEAAAPSDDDNDEDDTKPPATPVPGGRPLASVPTDRPPVLSVDALVTAAQRSTSKRTQALGEKLDDLATQIRQRLTDERQAAEKTERAKREREAAAAEVERLKAELAAAQAKLRPARQGGVSTVQRESKPLSDAQRKQLDAMRAKNKNTDPCANGCGYVAGTKAGKKAHERGSKCPNGGTS